MVPHRLILASASPRRRLLLDKAGVTLGIYPVDIDETHRAGELPTNYVRRMAEEKMDAALQALREPPRCDEFDTLNNTLLTADTIVTIDDLVLGKPETFDEAQAAWERLSGRTHEVITAFSLARGEPKYAGRHTQLVTTKVAFKNLTHADMQAYWDTGEPLDKAGGYAIQGAAADWVEQISGGLNNVIGLPVAEVLKALDQINRLDI